MQTLQKPREAVNPLTRARAYAAKVPGAVERQGGDKHTYALACKLVNEFGLSGHDALTVLREWNFKCTPPWRESALARKVTCAGRPVSASGGNSFGKWPKRDETRIAQIVRGAAGTLEAWTPCVLDGDGPHTEQYVDALFPGNPLLCVGTKDAFTFDTKPREEWRGELSGCAYIVPSAMSKREGVKQDGNISKHTLDGTGPRQHLVVEFDQGTPDEHSAVLLHLAQFAPLVLALHSGGKSIHGWFLRGEPRR
jgi:hypothetical protein